jgi:hypothetical protein
LSFRRPIMVPGPLLVLGLLVAPVGAIAGPARAEPSRPIKIGALTDSWGPTPAIVGLRDGLQELGYREHDARRPGCSA